MAALSDFPHAIRYFGPIGFLKTLWCEIQEDELFTAASALAYSWLFAVFPFILFLITLIPLLPHETKTEFRKELVTQVYTLPKDAADMIWINVSPRLDEVLKQQVTALPLIGLLITLWAASGGVSSTMSAIDKCYDVQKPRPIYKQRPLAVGLTCIVVTLVLLVVLLIPIGSIATRIAVEWFGDWVKKYLAVFYVFEIVRYVVGAMLMFAVLAVLYHFGPNLHRRKFRFITPGSLFVVLMWVATGYGFKVYIDEFGKYNQTYGTVGGVAILLLLFYIDALLLLIGAEINAGVDQAIVGKPVGVAEAEVDGIPIKPETQAKLDVGAIEHPELKEPAKRPENF